MIGITRRQLLKFTAALPFLRLPTPPNICLVMADDLCRNDLGCYGPSLVHTPNIDALAAGGMRFLNAYSPCPKCAPARWCLMTGRQMDQAHSLTNDSIILAEDHPTIASWLKGRGYATAAFGKWGINNGAEWPVVSSSLPNACGFDYFYGFRNHGEAVEYFPPYVWENGQQVSVSGYSLDLLLQAALNWLSTVTQPFFLYYPTPAPHANNTLVWAGQGGFDETPISPLYAGLDWPESEKHLASLITRMDSSVGQLVAALPTNTIIFFCSDNGPTPWGGHQVDFFSEWPYRETKDYVFEGGIRVPLIVRWPGVIAPGSVSQHVCLISDIFETVRDILDG